MNETGKEIFVMTKELKELCNTTNYYYSLVVEKVKSMAIKGEEITKDILPTLDNYKEFETKFIEFKRYWDNCNDFIEEFKDTYSDNNLFNKLENTIDYLYDNYDLYSELYGDDIYNTKNNIYGIVYNAINESLKVRISDIYHIHNYGTHRIFIKYYIENIYYENPLMINDETIDVKANIGVRLNNGCTFYISNGGIEVLGENTINIEKDNKVYFISEVLIKDIDYNNINKIDIDFSILPNYEVGFRYFKEDFKTII